MQQHVADKAKNRAAILKETRKLADEINLKKKNKPPRITGWDGWTPGDASGSHEDGSKGKGKGKDKNGKGKTGAGTGAVEPG